MDTSERVADPAANQQEVAAAQAAEEPAPPAPVEETQDETLPPDAPLVGETLEVDSFGDNDSSLGDDESVVSSSTSITSTHFQYAHGKRYHAYTDAQYPLPNNEQEMDRLEVQHRIWDIMLSGRLTLAPISPHLSHAIDLGCGTGAWAIEFADAHPDCDVIGLDLSPIQPSAVPPNLTFIVDDATAEWTFLAPFDYVHTRTIASGIKDWDALLEQCFKHLKPGGWVELQEFHMPFTCDDGSAADSALHKWTNTICETMIKMGVDTSVKGIDVMPRRLADRGFVNVEEVHSKWPIGPWAKGGKEKKIGALFLREIYGNIENIGRKLFVGLLKYTDEEYDKFSEEVREDMLNRQIHMYMPMQV
jgi:SAM-dependent methyltransferase